jgi:hypothetical protein
MDEGKVPPAVTLTVVFVSRARALLLAPAKVAQVEVHELLNAM